MNVLCLGNMYPPHHLGGYELVWQGVVAHLRGGGHTVGVLTTGHREAGVQVPDEPDVHRDLRWYWHDHAFPRLSPLECLRLERHNAAVFDRHVEECRPDVVAWWAMGGMSLSLLARARRHGLPSAAFVIDDWLLYGPRFDRWLRTLAWLGPLGPVVRRATAIPTRLELAAVSRWVFVSGFTRDSALDAWPRLTGTQVAHIGIDPAFLGPGPERGWGWRLLYLGRIDERKGITTALDALSHLPEQATLTVVGDGDGRHLAELRRHPATLAGRARIEPGRSRPEVPGLIDAHDAVVFPSRWHEPWGLVPLEAMARGRPVVSTLRGGAREYLRPGENCLAFDVDDARGLAAGVGRLAGDPTLRARLRATGVQTAREHTDERYARTVEAVLAETARGRAP